MDITEKASTLADYELCDHCLGRQFARLGYGLENFERGQIIREKLDAGEEIVEDDFDSSNVPEGREVDRSDSCQICGGLFQDMDQFVKRAVNALQRYELETYLVGTRPPADAVQAEEELWEEVGIDWVEPLKSELNRLIGKELEAALQADRDIELDVDFDRADINLVLDIGKDRVELQINSLLVHGFYNKLERGIPQTKWPCGNCRGKGCDECDWTGKQYQESVEEIVAEPFIKAFKALESKFHGAGREDVDARCLGKREFVLELIEPEKRFVDIDELVEEVNESDKVQVFGIEFCGKDMVERVKKRRANKTYRALVETEDPVSDEDLAALSQLEGVIRQKTPSRVDHRRASKTRKRKALAVSWERKGENRFEMEVTGEAGLYIKELISGDREKTDPSVSQLLGTQATCLELDVIDIEKPSGYEDV